MNPRAWFELARVSNLPTVWANVVTGVVWGMACHVPELGIYPAAVVLPNLPAVLNQAFMLLVAGSLIYTAGMFLNDVFDRRVDQAERPQRPIPSGRVCPHRAAAWAAVMLVAGVAAGALFPSPWVLPLLAGLAATAILYNAVHQRWPGSVLLMAACRALIVFAATMAVWTADTTRLAPRLLPAAALFAYTLLIAAVARQEVRLARVPLVIALIVAMPLLDAAFCLAAGHRAAACFCVGCSALTLAGQRFIKGS